MNSTNNNNNQTKTPEYYRKEGKPEWNLVDFPSLEPLVRALEYGKQKHGKFSYKEFIPADILLDKLYRHLIEIHRGNFIDPETGEHHIGGVLANAMFYSYHHRANDMGRITTQESQPWYDVDRYKAFEDYNFTLGNVTGTTGSNTATTGSNTATSLTLGPDEKLPDTAIGFKTMTLDPTETIYSDYPASAHPHKNSLIFAAKTLASFGTKREEIAKQLGLSVRTVYRYLKSA